MVRVSSLHWRHNGRDGISNQQPRDCLLSRLIRRRSKKTSKSRVTGLCAGNSPVTGEFPAQMDSGAENLFIWWRHHVMVALYSICLVGSYQWLLNFFSPVFRNMVFQLNVTPTRTSSFYIHVTFSTSLSLTFGLFLLFKVLLHTAGNIVILTKFSRQIFVTKILPIWRFIFRAYIKKKNHWFQQ